MNGIPSPPPDDRSVRRRLARLRLRFPDPALESAFRADRIHFNLGSIRFAFMAGIALWVAWGFLLRPHMLALSDQRLDMVIRYGVFIPMLVGGFALSYTSLFRRIWEWVSVAIAVITIVVWVYYTSNVLTLPAEYGYIGVILITAFTYSLLRLRFILVVLITGVGIAAYLPYAYTARYIVDVSRVLATLYLISFGILGGLAAYQMERFTRQLFVRERQLDQERQRSDGLLLNILPPAVIEQLKASSGERVADAFEEVSVVFVDAVGSTAQAARSSPSEFAGALDALFRRFDELADRLGLEKIKTIGDAYMAVAGAPVPASDHAASAVAMVLEILADCQKDRWPSGDPIVMRGGVATGPAVAGVIGERKFAYDVWGDTVNLASRLEEHAAPGQVLVSEQTATAVMDRFALGPVRILDIRGKGQTPVRALLGPTETFDDGELSLNAEPS
jgi:class 3 adenylate cyclase